MPMPRKSLADHKLNGTTPEYASTPDLAPGRPRYPKGISRDAKKAFKRIAAMLEERRSITRGDEEVLRLYSILFDRHAKAMAKLAEEGEVVTYHRLNNRGESVPSERPNLWLRIAQDSEKHMTALLRDLGLTPGTRSKVKPTASPEQPKPVDPEEHLLERPSTSAPEEIDLDSIDETVVQ